MPQASAGKNITDAAQLATGVVGSDEIADNIVAAIDVATDAIEADEIKAGAVGASEIATDAVGTDEIATSGVGSAEIANDSILAEDINSAAAIPDSKLAAISTAGKVDGAALTNLANIPAGAGLIPSANIASGSCKVAIPQPLVPLDDGPSSVVATNVTFATNTTAFVGCVSLPIGITVNKFSFRLSGVVNTAGTWKIALFSEDGQTRHINLDSATLDTINSLHTIAVGAVALAAGNYYLVIVPVGTCDVQPLVYVTSPTIPFTSTTGLAEDVSGEPVLEGTLTVTASTMPATIDPTAITGSTKKTMVFRLDN